MRGFDLALQRGEDQFVKRRIYLTLERGRDIALRNLLRRVFVAGGFDEPKDGEATPVRRTRVPVVEFQAAISMGSGGDIIDSDEVECLIANMIYKVRATFRSFILVTRAIVVAGLGASPWTTQPQDPRHNIYDHVTALQRCPYESLANLLSPFRTS